MLRGLVVVFSLLTLMACGVKGDPLPPETPRPLGRGKPTYKKATEQFSVPKIPPVRRQKKLKEDSDDESI